MLNPLIIGASQRAALNALRDFAAAHPTDMLKVMELIKSPAGKAQHMNQMGIRTIDLPVAYAVTFSIETGHAIGPCRHMSLSSSIKNRTPIYEAVWMVCQELGFIGETQFEGCHTYPEKLQRGPDPKRDRAWAINVIQPLAMTVQPPGFV